MSRAVGPPWQHEVAHDGCRIVNANLYVVGNDRAELGEHGPGLDDGTRTKGLELVPIRRQAEHGSRIAGAKRANDQIVNLFGMLEDDKLRIVVEADVEL